MSAGVHQTQGNNPQCFAPLDPLRLEGGCFVSGVMHMVAAGKQVTPD